MREGRRACGFTLIEFAVVVTVSGILLAATTDLYANYLKKTHYLDTVSKLNTIQSSLSNYSATAGRLPFPSDPTLPITSPDSGCECGSCSNTVAACAALAVMASGCIPSGGICKVPGHHHTQVNPSPGNDPVYIGGVPYNTIKKGISNSSYNDVAAMDALDVWGFQIGYAVSSASTSASTYGQGVYGVIDVTTENGVELTSPPGSAYYVLVDYGDNHMGAYNTNGVMAVPCVAGTKDFENCNGDYKFISGLRSMGANASYFDDVIIYSAFAITKLWDYTYVGSSDIYNLNVGGVGVGTPTPTQELEVNGSISTDTSATETEICDATGAHCWAPNLLAGPVSGNNPSTNWCPPAPTGYVNVVTGLQYGQVQCTLTPIPLVPAPINQSCAAGHYATGFSRTTGLICN